MVSEKMIELNLKLISDNNRKLAFIQAENIDDIHSFIYNFCKWTSDLYFLRCNGFDVVHVNDIDGAVQIIPRLRGGKGGFGSMLRAIGAQIEKTTNREACRDLSGRRLRDINEEQRLKKWISQQAEREREIEERRKKKLEKLSAEPRHQFEDEDYFAERSEMCEKLNDAFEQGVQASSSCVKRKIEEKETPVKKQKKLLIDIDEFSSSDDDSVSSDKGEHLINTEEASSNTTISEELKDNDCAHVEDKKEEDPQATESKCDKVTEAASNS